MIYEQLFLLALLCTAIIEIPIIILLIKYLYKNTELKIFTIIFTGLIASALTLPYFWFVLPAFISSRTLFIIFGEITVILVEATIYKKFLNLTITQALVVSLLSNGASIIFGLLVL